MHQPIRDNLEEYLTGSARKVPQEFEAHLAQCESCASELRLLQTQAQMLRALQSDESVEPRAGFYARVRERIEQQGPFSIWSVFLQPSFGRRLAVASAALVILLGTYLVTTEPGDHSAALAPSAIETAAPVSSADLQQNQQQQRDAVLVNLATYHDYQ